MRQKEIDNYLMLLSIQHNPYRKKMDATKLHRHLIGERSRLESGARPKRRGIQVGELQQAFGGVKRVTLTREEFLARQKPRARGVAP